MKKIAFVVTRYGREVNGGAEQHCRMLAERLTPWYEVDVLTTTGKKDTPTPNDFPIGETIENGVHILRFPTQELKEIKSVKTAKRIRYRAYHLGLLRPIANLFPRWNLCLKRETAAYQSRRQYAPELIAYLETHKADYKAIITICYNYPLVIFGSLVAPEKTILIPTAHPEKHLFAALHTQVFTRVAHIAFNTGSEQHLCQQVFGRKLSPSSIVGVGIEQVEPADWTEVKAKYHLPDNYSLYAGRIVKPKLQHLLPYFQSYRNNCDASAKLVLVGGVGPEMHLPQEEGVICTGFINDAEKEVILQHAQVVINSSHMESLSLIALESMSKGIPLLVNGKCEVLKEHSKLSGAALWYGDAAEFRRQLHRLLTDEDLRRKIAERGPRYVAENYNWETILTKIRTLIEQM